MPSEKAHLEAVRRNVKVLRYLRNQPEICLEWIAIVAFYTAVHVVEAVFAKSDVHSSDHKTRLDRLKCDAKCRSLFHPFRQLKVASEIARYLGTGGVTPGAYQCFSDYMSSEDVEKTLVKGHLAAICREAQKLLGSDVVLELS